MAEFPAPPGGILLTHFIVSDDLEPSVRNRDEDELAGLQFSRKRERAFLCAAAGLTPAVEPAPKGGHARRRIAAAIAVGHRGGVRSR
jgi:hypothetical protein